MKKIAVIGSTGSIGTQTLNIVRRNRDKYKIVALTAGNNEKLLIDQAEEFLPDLIGLGGKFTINHHFSAFEGSAAAEQVAASCDADIFVISVVGMAALLPSLAAVRTGRRVALANKEALVCAGDILLREAAISGAEILPIDSEHSALFQCLKQGGKDEVNRLILTASGGPFYTYTKEMLRSITPAQAVKHPTWNMGQKISVDSATMANKGLELIEAYRLYGIKNIDYVIHPESIIHSLVQYIDGSTFAQMSYPNMELAVQYALTYPDREICESVRPFDFKRPLTFLEKNKIFKAPELALECINAGGTAPAIYNCANEAAVNLFLNNKIAFTDIINIVEEALNAFDIDHTYGIDRLFELNSKILKKVGQI